MASRTTYIIGGIIIIILIIGGAYFALTYKPPAPKVTYKVEIQSLPDEPEYTILFVTLNVYRNKTVTTDTGTVVEKPFADPLIRQALAWATPYEAIYETVYRGLMRPYYGVIPFGMPGWTDFGINKYTYNLTKAQELISKTDAYKNNRTYQIEIMYNLGNQARATIATLLQNSWGRLTNMAGDPIFQISVSAYNWPTVLAKGETGDYDVWIIGWAPDYVDPDNYATPMFYGATDFSYLEVVEVTTAAEVANYVKTGAKVIETPNYYVVVGERGTGFTPTVTGNKPFAVVSYEVNWTATPTIEELMEQGLGFAYINPAFYRNVTADALIIAGQTKVFDPALREAIYNAIHIISNKEVPILWVGQYVPYRVRWTWVEGYYYHPVLPVRWDMLYEKPDAPVVDIGIKDYKNDPSTFVMSTIGWPRSFDPAASYESFGWDIFYQTGAHLLTYWKGETADFTPDAGVAWAFSPDKQWLFFVIRGGMVAYDHWNNKTYPIDASDVLFTIWRIARLHHSVSWMINAFIDVNGSTWYNETEFDNVISQLGGLVAGPYGGGTQTVNSLSDLLNFFGYTGDTAGVVAFKLTVPYPAILPILADPFTKILAAEYVLGANYTSAMQATNNGKDPAGFANYVGDYWKTDWTHALVDEKPISTGPYYLKEYERDSYMVFEANPYYWNKTLWDQFTGDKVFHKRVIIIIANEWATRKQQLITGTVDTTYVPAENIPEVNGTEWGGGGALTMFVGNSLVFSGLTLGFMISGLLVVDLVYLRKFLF